MTAIALEEKPFPSESDFVAAAKKVAPKPFNSGTIGSSKSHSHCFIGLVVAVFEKFLELFKL